MALYSCLEVWRRREKTKTYEFEFNVADENDILITWYDADVSQDPVVAALATLQTPNAILGIAIFSTDVINNSGQKAFISSKTNFIADIEESQTEGSLAIPGALEIDGLDRRIKESIKGHVTEGIMANINGKTYHFLRSLPIGGYQLNYDPTKENGHYPAIVYETEGGNKLTINIKKGNFRRYKFELIE